jgi:cellobiose-specific phosphotransferase system component IIC
MLRAVRKGLMLAIPFLMLGSFALVIISLPVPAYQRVMMATWGGRWMDIIRSAISASFGMLSLVMVLAVSYSYTLECNEAGKDYVNPMIAALVYLGSLLRALAADDLAYFIRSWRAGAR